MDNVILGTFAGCLIGGVLPWLNTEVVVAGAALIVAPAEIILLVVAAAMGQTFAKCSLYALARWAPHRLPKKVRDLLARPRALTKGQRAVSLAIFTSSTVGLPPFFLTTLAAGALKVPFTVFAGAGLAGSAIRYAVLASAAALVTGGLDFGLP